MLCNLDLVKAKRDKSLLHKSQATLHTEITSEISSLWIQQGLWLQFVEVHTKICLRSNCRVWPRPHYQTKRWKLEIHINPQTNVQHSGENNKNVLEQTKRSNRQGAKIWTIKKTSIWVPWSLLRWEGGGQDMRRKKRRTDGHTDRDGKKENLEGRGERMAEEPDGVRRNVKIAVRKSVSEWSEEGESECREVSCRLHRGREKSQSYLTQQHWNRQTRDDTKPRQDVPQPFCLSRWVNSSLYATAGRLQAKAPDSEASSLDVGECLLLRPRSGRLCVCWTNTGRTVKKKKKGDVGGNQIKKIPLLQLNPNICNLAVSVAQGQRVYWH